MKKLGIIILFILLFGVWGLWYLGGPAVGGINQNSAITTATAPVGLNEDEKLIALVQTARAGNGRPLLDPAAAAAAASAFRLTLNDLQISTDESPDAARRYGQAVSQLFQNINPKPAKPGFELQLALEAFEEQAPTKATAVRRAAEYYGALAAELQRLETPEELKAVHLNLLNAVLGLAEVDSYLAEILTEPIMALDQAPTFASRYKRLAGAVMILNQVLAYHVIPLIAVL